MKNHRRILAVVLTVILAICLFALPAMAATETVNGMELTLVTDKAEYAADEQITASLTVKNITDAPITGLVIKHQIPEGIKTVSGDVEKIVPSLAAGESVTLAVVLNADVPASTGDYAIVAVAAALVLSAAGLVFLSKNAVVRKGVLSVFLCCVLVGGLVMAVPAQAETNDFKVTTTIKVDGKDVVLTAVVQQTIVENPVSVNIAPMTNGAVIADKESYKLGDTVNLTITPATGYSQKLYINDEPLLLDWKTNVYSFVATEENYAITGGFVPTFVSSTHEKWDTANNAQGVLNTYYTSGDSSWLGIDSAAESITVKVKNYQLGDGTGVDGFHVLLGFKIKGTNYTFRVIKQSGKYYCQRAGFKNAEGKDQWTKFELDAATVAAILGDGVDFKLERIAANKLAAYVNGTKYDTFEIPNATAADAVTKIYIGHAGNLNEKIAIPYTVADPIFRVTGGDWNLDNQYDGSVTILNKTKDGSTIITNASDYKGVSVTVKDYLPTYDANGAITPNGFAMQFAFIFDNGKQYLVRLHNTDSNSPNYKLQNMGGTNCLTGWKWQADLNAAQKKNLLEGDGVKITVMLEGPNAVLYADGQKKATVPLGEEYAGKLVQIQLCMNGNKTGGNIEIPFELIKASEEHIHTPATAVVENKTDATCGADGSYEEIVKCECGHEISRTPKVIPATGAHIYDEGVVTKEPTYTETGVKTYTCGTCGDTKTEDIPMLEKTVVDTKFTGKSLALEGAVTINLYVTYTVDGVTMNEDFVEANAGVLYWSVEDMPADRDAAILGTETHKADVKCAGVYQGNTEFFAMSHGIPAKCYGDTVYFRTYILVDGEYQYGEVEEYSILAYCENVFKN